jgi:hypothetical protein
MIDGMAEHRWSPPIHPDPPEDQPLGIDAPAGAGAGVGLPGGVGAGGLHTVPAVLHWRIEQALEGIGQPSVLVVDREPVDGVPAWIADGRRHQDELLPVQWRDHLAERHYYIGVRLRERGADLAVEQPTWRQDLGRLPSEPWRMFDWHRTAAEVDVLRTKYRIDLSEPQAIPDKLRGNPVADQLRERVAALHKAAALSTAPEMTESTRQHYAASAAERSAATRSALLSAAEGVQQATSMMAVTLTDVVTETATETTPKPSTAEAEPASPASTDTTPVAAASPTTAQEGTIMSDPIDETLEHVGRQAGRAGQTIASEVARQAQRVADERRRQVQETQRKAERERDVAVREAQRKAERQREQAEREAAREQERDDRLASRYPNPEQRDGDAAALAEGAVLGAAAAAIESQTDADAAALTSDGRDETAAETASIAGEGQTDADSIAATESVDETQYDEFELRDREMLRQAGINPDEVSSSSSTDSSLTVDPSPTPDLARGDDSMER